MLPALALLAALAWPAASPPAQRPPSQAPAEVSGPRPAVQPTTEVRRALPTAPSPRSTPTVATEPSPVRATPSAEPVADVPPPPAATPSSPGLEHCVEQLLGEVRLDC